MGGLLQLRQHPRQANTLSANHHQYRFDFGDAENQIGGHVRESTLHLQNGYRGEVIVGDLAVYFVVSMIQLARSASDALTAGQSGDSKLAQKLEASSL